MQFFIDLDLRQVVSGPGDRTPLPLIQCSSQDTLEQDVYYVRGGSIVDAGPGVALRFGLFKSGTTTPSLALVPLVFPTWSNTTAYNVGDSVTWNGNNYVCITANTGNDPATTPADWTLLPPSGWTRKQDANNAFYWQGFLNLNTTQMASAIANTNPLLCTGEFRYQLSDGEIVHSIYVPFSIFPALVTETGVPPINVQNTYPDVSTLELKVNKGAPGGYAPLDTGSRVPVVNLPANAEYQSNKDVANGYAGLDSTGKLKAAEFNLDNLTLVFDATTGKLEVAIDNQTLIVGAGNKLQAVGSITIAVGTVTQLAAGATPTASISGTAPNYKLNLGIPAGQPGAPGTPGTPGQTPTFSIGSVTTLAAGSAATVTVTGPTGSPPAYVLNFGIPQGAGITSLSDAETTEGFSLINNGSTGALKRILFDPAFSPVDTGTEIKVNPPAAGIGSLVDHETADGLSLIFASSGVLNRIKFDPAFGATNDGAGRIIVPNPAAGISSATDLEAGFEWNYHNLGFTTSVPYSSASSGGGAAAYSSYGEDTTHKAFGVRDVKTAITVNSWVIDSADLNSAGVGHITPMLGVLQWRARSAVQALGISTDYPVFRLGVWDNGSSGTPYPIIQGMYFEYNLAVGANWLCTIIDSVGTTQVDSGVAVDGGNYHKFKILTNANWTSVGFYIDGTLVQTLTPNAINVNLGIRWLAWKALGGTTQYFLSTDWWGLKYLVAT